MSHNKVRVVQRNIGPGGSKKKPAQTARHEERNEAEGEQHRRRKLDPSPPQTHHPAQDEDRGRNCDQQSGQCEHASEQRIHAAHEHVMAPDNEAQGDNRDPASGHDLITENRFPNKRRQNFRCDTHRRNDDDVHLGMAEKPEQVLP